MTPTEATAEFWRLYQEIADRHNRAIALSKMGRTQEALDLLECDDDYDRLDALADIVEGKQRPELLN